MARPVKCRKVKFLPETTQFLAKSKNKEDIKEIVLKVEELEAMRLKDIQNLTQQECADLMGISRQTFQNIIDKAREKIAIALTEGHSISIKGGNYAYSHCRIKCKSCDKTYEIQFTRDKEICPKCHSKKVVCKNKKISCKGLCTK